MFSFVLYALYMLNCELLERHKEESLYFFLSQLKIEL